MPDRKLPPVIRPILRWIDTLTYGCLLAAALCLTAIFVLILAEVGARNFAGTSLDFSWDYAAYMMGALFMLAAGSALRSGAHVRVTVLLELLPPSGQRWLNLAACLAGLVVAALLLWSIGSMAWLSLERGTTSATVITTPLWLPQAVMTFGAFVFFLQMLAQALRVSIGYPLSADEAGKNDLDG